MGTVYRKENSPYLWIAYWLDDGTYHKESSRTTDRKKAEALLAKRIRAHGRLAPGMAQLGLVLEHELGGLRLNWLLSLALASFHSSNGEHLRDILRRTVRIVYRLGNPKLSELDDAVGKYVELRQAEGVSERMLDAEVSIIRRGYRLAWRAGVIDEVPAIPEA